MTLDRRPSTQLLGGCPLFGGVDADGLARDRRQGRSRSTSRRTTSIARQGEIGTGLLRHRRRPVRVVRDGEELAPLGPGEFFGELSVLDGQPRIAQVIADADDLPRARRPGTSKRSSLEQPGVALAILRGVAGRLRDVTEAHAALSASADRGPRPTARAAAAARDGHVPVHRHRGLDRASSRRVGTASATASSSSGIARCSGRAVAAHGGDRAGHRGRLVLRRVPRAPTRSPRPSTPSARSPPSRGRTTPTIRVRMGIHTGEAELDAAASLRRPRRQPGGADRGGRARRPDPRVRGDRRPVADDLPDGVALRDLGEHRLKDLRARAAAASSSSTACRRLPAAADARRAGQQPADPADDASSAASASSPRRGAARRRPGC